MTIIAAVIAVIDDFVISHQPPLMTAVILAKIEALPVAPIAAALFIAFGVLRAPAMRWGPRRRIGGHRQDRQKGRGNDREGEVLTRGTLPNRTSSG
jgi:hypothetical protein